MDSKRDGTARSYGERLPIVSGNAEAERTQFEALDALVRTPGSSGFSVVLAEEALRGSLIRHSVRRARGLERRVLQVARVGAEEPWSALGARLGIPLRTDPSRLANELLRALSGAVVLVEDARPSAWGMAVWGALDHAFAELGPEDRPLVLVVSEPGIRWMREVIPIDARLTSDDRLRFVEALVVDEVRDIPHDALTLPLLERGWRARRAPITSLEPREVDVEVATLLARLRIAERAWPITSLGRLGSAHAVEQLEAAGLIEIDADHLWVVPTPEWSVETSFTRVDCLAVAQALAELVPADPWARMRAAELYALSGEAERAEAAALAAIGLAAHGELRKDLWARYAPDHERLPRAAIGERWLRAGEAALQSGDSEWARTFAGRAIAGNADRARAMLLLGRAEAVKGDLTAAATALARAEEASSELEQKLEASAWAADVACLAGKFDEARVLASAACASGRRDTRSLARNVLGKLLLAAGRLDDAERHFAEDGYLAALEDDPKAALRAELNRAIVSLTRGRHEDARVILRSVLARGEQLGDARVVAYAVTNLAVVATMCQEYAEALALAERSIEARRALGENIPTSRALMNLAALRLKVGLAEEAEQALAFGRSTAGVNLSPAHDAEYALVSAKVHFARGRMLQARAQLECALTSARAAGNASVICECHLWAARVALEDGDIERTQVALTHAAETAETPARRAAVAVLRAANARAAGEAFEDQAHEARGLAQCVHDPELLREAHFLLYLARLAAGDSAGARDQLRIALRFRDDVARALPSAMCARYLARRELAELQRAEARSLEGASATESPPSSRAVVRAGTRQLVGQSVRVVALRAAIQKVGPSDATVLVIGESGTGKELVAEALHECSQRQGGPLVKVNCAALTESLLASELFGHEKGAFTGALSRRRGRFELADGGTLFLDEIGDIAPATQVALLRVLQERTIERVGGGASIRVDVRVVAATHRNLEQLVERGLFRQDLYYRLRGIVLEVPALRSMRDDVPSVARALLTRIANERGEFAKRLGAEALELLSAHDWPGNVRELENALRTASVFATGGVIEARDLFENVDTLRALARASRASGVDQPTAKLDEMEPGDLVYDRVRTGVSLGEMKRKLERECIERALQDSGGNITRAALLLGMKRPRLSQLVKKYRLFAEDSEEV